MLFTITELFIAVSRKYGGIITHGAPINGVTTKLYCTMYIVSKMCGKCILITKVLTTA